MESTVLKKDKNISIRGNKKIIRAWTVFDWANSVYQLSITSAILPAYYDAVTRSGDSSTVSFFGMEVENTSLYAWTVAASFLFVALTSPLFSSIADYTGRRKLFMKIYTWLGALSCAALFFFNKADGTINTEFGIIAFFLAGIGYTGGLVFYNSWLPEISPQGQQDRISARGYALGYIGGVVLLVINLLMITQPQFFGLDGFGKSEGMPARISFITVGIWWLVFAHYTFYYLPDRSSVPKGNSISVLNGYKELRKVWKEFRKNKILSTYLAAVFFTLMGVLTVMYMAANYGKKELRLDDKTLIPTILIIQLVGVAGSIGFARLSERIGNVKALVSAVFIWIGICVGAYFVTGAGGFMILAAVVGLVMGGVQSLTRSGYSRLLPSEGDHTSYFSFYDVTEKMAVVFGTFLFGLFEMITGTMRTSILMLGIVFIFGLFFFMRIRGEKELLPDID